jgi:protease-4
MPPPGMMPPFMMPPMFMQPPKQGGFFRGLLTTLLVTIVLGSLSLNVYLLLFAGIFASDGGSTTGKVIESGDPSQEIAVIPIRGVITSKTFTRFQEILQKVEENKNVKALVIDIDTPGGEVTASDQIYDRLLKFKSDHKLSIVIKQGSLATSGGYYISCAGDYIIAEPTTITANIGVLLPNYNWAELAAKYGIKEVTSVASGSTYKNSGSPFQPYTERDAKYWQQLTDGMYVRFKDIVKKARPGLKVSIDEAADGRAILADEAIAMGLVDQKGYAKDAYQYAATSAKLSKPHVVKYEYVPTFIEALSGSEAESRMPGAKLSFGNVKVDVDQAFIDDMLTPRPMYIWRGQ